MLILHVKCYDAICFQPEFRKEKKKKSAGGLGERAVLFLSNVLYEVTIAQISINCRSLHYYAQTH